MVSYKELGLVNTREMFAKAIKGGYAIPAFNFNNMEQMQAIIVAGHPPGFVGRTQIRQPDAAALHGTGRRRVCQGAGQKHSHLPAPRPRQLVRTV